MKTKHVVVVPYAEQWKNEFAKIKSQILDVLGSLAMSVEHVGSTSVVGLWAKPIIDIDAVIRDETLLPAAIERLESIGYSYEGDLGIAGRYAFRYESKPDVMLHHLYVCPQNSAELRRHLRFRDYLREHLEAVEKYSQIKREAAALYPDDIEGYMNHKDNVIKEIFVACGL